MKKIIFFLFVLGFSFNVKAQVDISGAMSISFVSASSFRDYLNINFVGSNDQLPTFSSLVEFMGEADYSLSQNFQLGIEYVVSIYSFNTSSSKAPFYKVSYNHHKPSLLAYYVIPGTGFKFKFGGGVGVRFLSLDEQLPNFPSSSNYTTTGFGFVLKAQGYTLLSGNLYANIGMDLRYDLPGEPSNGDKFLFDNTIKQNINLNSVSLGVHLGIAYFL